MTTRDGSALSRRQLVKGIGGLAAFSTLIPMIPGSVTPAPCASVLTPGDPESVDMSSERLGDVFARLERRIRDGLFPGASVLIARNATIVAERAFGAKARGATEPVTVDTLFDIESMTKVIATAASVLVLAEQGAIDLSQPVAAYLPCFGANGKSNVTIRDMLRYCSGLPVDNQFLDEPDVEGVWQLMAETPLEYAPGTSVLYSDLTYRLLGRLVEAVCGADLDTFARAAIWGPLGMNDTLYKPPPSLSCRIAATAYSARRGYLIRGEVQDEQDFALGGVVGCDGVFSTARDMATFCQMILNKGAYGDARIFSQAMAEKMVKNQTPHVTAAATDTSPLANLLSTPKGYGWEISTRRFSTGGMRLSPGSYGKTGGAGTFMWVDPGRRLVAVLLTNHGLPAPFDEPQYNRMIDTINPGEFFDGVVSAVDSC